MLFNIKKEVLILTKYFELIRALLFLYEQIFLPYILYNSPGIELIITLKSIHLN